jgi:REP-associated tyrosine transposase
MSGVFTNNLYHIVFSTKNRINLIQDDFEDELYAYIGGILKHEKGRLIFAGGTENHIHLLAIIHQTISISDMLRKIKSNSSLWINKNHKLNLKFSWQEGYGSFTVSESGKKDVITYIKNQKEHHKKIDFKEEFLLFLHKHGIEYNEKYVWQ